MSSSSTRDPAKSNLAFASLTPADLRTSSEVEKVAASAHDQGNYLSHHRKFIRREGGALAATMSPTFSPDPAATSSGITTEADNSEDDEHLPALAPCYVLSLDHDLRPFQPAVGYWFGTGDSERDPDTLAVDILLPPSSHASTRIYQRQGYFAFDAAYGRLWLHARHKGIRVDDRSLDPKAKVLLKSRARVSIGPYRFIFQFKVSDEVAFQAAKRQYLSQYQNADQTYETTSVTPSVGDVQIQDWVLHGVAGSSHLNLIHAASNTRSGQVVAVKRLRVSRKDGKAQAEVELYDALLNGIRDHRYSRFIMQKFDVLEHHTPYTTDRELYLLWTPLARGDFSMFGMTGRRRHEAEAVKVHLFVETLLGLSALHDAGWIHRDLKPENIGILYTDQKPHAVILDQGQAVRQLANGYTPSPGSCGTIGYLAPELEDCGTAPSYGKEVDIWSMGAVAFFLFEGGRIPWSQRFNMFEETRNAMDPTLEVFHEARNRLRKQSKDSLRYLIGDMLETRPKYRATIPVILDHPALRSIRERIDTSIENDMQASRKRRHSSLIRG